MTARKSAAARGYGHAHRKLREHWAPKVAAGNAVCWRCTNPIVPGTPWDLGHDDLDRSKYRGPEHRYCNRAAPGTSRAAQRPATESSPVEPVRSHRRWW